MRILKALAAAAALIVPLLGAVPAGAATPDCQTVVLGLCGSWDTPVAGGADLDVYQQRAASDTPVIVWRQSKADPAEDFELVPVEVTGLKSSVTGLCTTAAAGTTAAPLPAGDCLTLSSPVNIEYAPDGVRSGFCVSVITSTERAAAALRPCDTVTAVNQTFNPYQTFNELVATDGDGAFMIFQNVLTGFVLNDRRSGGPGSPVISYPLGSSGSTPNQLWEPNG